MAGMAAQITDDHLATFCTEATWDGLAEALVEKSPRHGRLVLYNAAMGAPGPRGRAAPRFGEVARRIHELDRVTVAPARHRRAHT